jgi:hypothetical protein
VVGVAVAVNSFGMERGIQLILGGRNAEPAQAVGSAAGADRVGVGIAAGGTSEG